MVEYVDWMLGTVIDTLRTSGAEDDTYLIASSDHGDLSGDYGLVEKIHSAHYDPLTRVPLGLSEYYDLVADPDERLFC